jgi:hypothetical protein
MLPQFSFHGACPSGQRILIGRWHRHLPTYTSLRTKAASARHKAHVRCWSCVTSIVRSTGAAQLYER